MPYLIDPIPDMEYQRYGPFGLVPDLTCGRYCLKSLLKYWHYKAAGERVTRLELPRPASTLRHWMGYDPWDDYQHSHALLRQSQKPADARAWEALITYARGPIIVSGDGIGRAFRGAGPIPAIGHVVLLIGVDANNRHTTFIYLDPLVGNAVQTASFADMHHRIDTPVTYARSTIVRDLSAANHAFYTRAHFDMFPWARW
jgi:hypothetical protein